MSVGKGQIAKKGDESRTPSAEYLCCILERFSGLLQSWKKSAEIAFPKKRQEKSASIKFDFRKQQHSNLHAQKGNIKNAPGYVNASWFVY